jgi:Domain of unknown function (DUF6531)
MAVGTLWPPAVIRTGLALKRYYNNQDTKSSAFGTGWRSAWHRSLNPVSASAVIVSRPVADRPVRLDLVAEVKVSDLDRGQSAAPSGLRGFAGGQAGE